MEEKKSRVKGKFKMPYSWDRKGGRPSSPPEMVASTIIKFKVKPEEGRIIYDLLEDTKADTLTALMRNFVSAGALWLCEYGQPENKVFYQRFAKKWDMMAHLSMYSDKMGLRLKEQQDKEKKANNEKKPTNKRRAK
jgi:hypothetical protein